MVGDLCRYKRVWTRAIQLQPRRRKKCYGYTPTCQKKMNLSRISESVKRGAEYVDDVLVVFTCSRKSEGRLICGIYKKAKIYAKLIDSTKNEREIKEKENKKYYAKYNIICNAEDAILINRDKRVKRLPRSSRKNGVLGHGQSSIWYVDKPERQNLKNDLLDYVENIIRQGKSK